MRPLDDLAALIVDAARSGGQRAVIGAVTEPPDAAGYARVDRGSGADEPVLVPGSLRGVKAGQRVRVTIQDNRPIVSEILSALPAPPVAATPAASTIAPGVNSTVSSGAYDYDIAANDWAAVKAYTKDIASSTRALAADINELRGDLADVAADLASLKATVNGVLATLESIRQALASQGHIT